MRRSLKHLRVETVRTAKNVTINKAVLVQEEDKTN